jgi:hypothetical protein
VRAKREGLPRISPRELGRHEPTCCPPRTFTIASHILRPTLFLGADFLRSCSPSITTPQWCDSRGYSRCQPRPARHRHHHSQKKVLAGASIARAGGLSHGRHLPLFWRVDLDLGIRIRTIFAKSHTSQEGWKGQLRGRIYRYAPEGAYLYTGLIGHEPG